MSRQAAVKALTLCFLARDAFLGPDEPRRDPPFRSGLRRINRVLWVMTGIPLLANCILHPLSLKTACTVLLTVLVATALLPLAGELDTIRQAAQRVHDESAKLNAWAQQSAPSCLGDREDRQAPCLRRRLASDEDYLFNALPTLTEAALWVRAHPQDFEVSDAALAKLDRAQAMLGSLSTLESSRKALHDILSRSWFMRACFPEQLQQLSEATPVRQQFESAMPSLVRAFTDPHHTSHPALQQERALSIPEPR